MTMKTVKELTRDQLVELKQNYLTQKMDEKGESPSYGELAKADKTITDDEIYAEYDGTMFSDDDFSCSCEPLQSNKRKPSKKNRFLKKLSDYPCLEELLFVMNGMKKEKMFLKTVKRNKDGDVVDCFTKKGAVLYERMFDLLHGIFTLAEVENANSIFEHIQETFDMIADSEY